MCTDYVAADGYRILPYLYMGMGHLLSWVPNGIFEGVRTQKKKESGSLQ
jgi:hypothetical protein